MRPVWRPSSSSSASASASSPSTLALVDGGDDVREPPAALSSTHHREHGLRLGARDLGRLAATTTEPLIIVASSPISASARARSRRSRSSSGCRTPSARWSPTTSGPHGAASPGEIARVHGAQPIDV